jgi:hypothetical protein
MKKKEICLYSEKRKPFSRLKSYIHEKLFRATAVPQVKIRRKN